MNRYQKVVIIVAAANIALMLLFPPFLDNPLRRGALPGFEGFYPVTMLGSKRVHGELLTLQLMFVLINALLAWLLLDRRTPQGDTPAFRYTRAIVFFIAGNLALVFAFPPFEAFDTLSRFEMPGFDGFYFILGDKRHRHFFVPLLHLEIILVVVNALIVWILFNNVRRAELFAKERILELAQNLPAEELVEVTRTLGDKTLHAGAAEGPHLGVGPDRRQHQDPHYHGPERRKGGDRRLKPRSA